MNPRTDNIVGYDAHSARINLPAEHKVWLLAVVKKRLLDYSRKAGLRKATADAPA
ncbi:MAG TPA: hypothetical protein VFS21_34360 [Roseiflexaceae bacterium]|nr:hypothetical protein [Roseiflexaceae bacterium]